MCLTPETKMAYFSLVFERLSEGSYIDMLWTLESKFFPNNLMRCLYIYMNQTSLW